MTYLQLINKVLVRLRENTAVSIAPGYTTMIGALINEVKEEIEDRGPWHALRTSVTGSMTPSTATVTLSTTNERSYILHGPEGNPLAWITTTDEERPLTVIDHREMLNLYALNPTPDPAKPLYVSFARSSTGLTAWFFPLPDIAYTYKFIMVIPQAELSDKTDVISIPAEPVWREALVRAIEERGEEFSGTIDRYARRAAEAYYAAVLQDFGGENLTFRGE